MSEFVKGSSALELEGQTADSLPLVETPETEAELAEAEKQRTINLFYDKRRTLSKNVEKDHRLAVHEALANFTKQLIKVYDGKDGRPNIVSYKFYHILVGSSMSEEDEKLGLTDIDIDISTYPDKIPDADKYSSMTSFVDKIMEDNKITPEMVQAASAEREAKEEASIAHCKAVKSAAFNKGKNGENIKPTGEAIAEFEEELEREGYSRDELFRYKMYHVLTNSTPPDYVSQGPFFDLPGQRIETFINSLANRNKN